MKQNKQNKQKSALYMPHYGIKTIVLTEHDKFDLYMQGYEEDGLGQWPNERKQYVFNRVKGHLLKEDAYFDLHPDQATIANKRWSKFCDDCIELVTLDQYLFGSPIRLLHPESYGKNFASNPVDIESMGPPSLIAGIPSIRMDH